MESQWIAEGLIELTTSRLNWAAIANSLEVAREAIQDDVAFEARVCVPRELTLEASATIQRLLAQRT